MSNKNANRRIERNLKALKEVAEVEAARAREAEKYSLKPLVIAVAKACRTIGEEYSKAHPTM